jgi:hypothetical protein
MNQSSIIFSQAARLLPLVRSGVQRYLTPLSVALMTAVIFASPVFAQSGDISGSTSNFTTLGTTILKLVVTLAGLAFVGLIIWGGLTLATNRPRGLAMIGGGMVGALLAGLAFVIVNTLTGQSVSPTGMLLMPSLW